MILIITRRVVIVYMQECMSMFVRLYIEFVCIQLTCVLMFVCSLHHACVSMFVRTTHFLCTRRIVCSVQQSGASGKIGWKGCVWASQSHLLCICICKMCVRALLCTCCDFVLVLYLRFTITRSHVLYLYLYCIVLYLYCACASQSHLCNSCPLSMSTLHHTIDDERWKTLFSLVDPPNTEQHCVSCMSLDIFLSRIDQQRNLWKLTCTFACVQNWPPELW